MSADVASRIFEPVFTTKEIGKGTGLGLSQVYGFARQSGGFVSIETAMGRGTEVMIHLPRTSPGVAADEVVPTPQLQVNGEGIVLVVEDDPAVRATTHALLQDLGYRVLEAENARSALDIVATGQPIELVFTDVIMPGGMNGIELANAITAQRPELPVLLTSGYTAQRLIPDSAIRTWPLLHKPYTQSALSLAVENAINRVMFEA
jgi:CheY-like chemotaxis protein